MSITRSKLKAMGLTEEQVETIIEDHLETVDPLKEKGKKADELEQKLRDAQKELDDLKASNGDDYKSRYEKEHADFEEYKKGVASEKAAAEKRSLYRKLLKDAGVKEDYLDDVTQLAQGQIEKVTVEKGALKDADKISDEIKQRFANYIGHTETRGADVQTPINNSGTKMTRAEIFRKDEHGKYVHSYQDRVNAIQQNLEATMKGA